MKQEKLDCSAKSCKYNCDAICYAGGIHIGGESADKTPETYCSTYTEKSNDFTSCASDLGCTTEPNSILCDAFNCAYNANKLCTANDVHINSGDSSCETFKLGR